MGLVGTLMRRLRARPDSEHEQAILRIVIVGAIWGYMGLLAAPATPELSQHALLVSGLALFFLVAVIIFTCLAIWPAPNVPRRIVGMVADTGGATFYMFLGEQYGASMIAVYLFVTFGNGFRFGRKHLFICQALSLIGLCSALFFVPFWETHRPIGVGLLVSLIILPLYVSTLLKRIHEARQRAEEANLAKTTFLANMSHEMRTPLNGIVGVADLLSTSSLTHHQAELVALLRNSVSVLRSLVDDVLDISKIEAGHLTTENVPFDVYLAAIELCDVLRPHAESKGIQVNVTLDPRLPYRVCGDPHHLRQVLLNLLGNAIKFTEKGEVSLRVKHISSSPTESIARFEVRDTGVGIPEDALPRIFERFVQADQSTTRRFGGTGLGTTIAKQLVEIMGGRIGVESVVGTGSTFWFEIPLGTPAPDDLDQKGSEEAESVSVVIVDPLRASEAIALFEAAGECCSVVSTLDAASALVVDLRRSGRTIRCLASYGLPAADIKAIYGLQTTRYPALIVIRDDIAVTDTIVSIGEVTVLSSKASASELANTIHASTLRTHQTESAGNSLSTLFNEGKAGATILVADDNSTNQAIIREMLSRAGYNVVLAADGEQALDLFESCRPDLALLDFNMPYRTGCEVVQAIRLMEAPTERTPAIILSASVTPEARERATKSGADAFVGKPFEAANLLRTVDELLATHAREDTRQDGGTEESRLATQGVVPANTKHAAQSGDGAESPQTISWPRIAQLEGIARNPRFVAELMRGFKDDAERLLTEIQLAVDSGDRIHLADSIHALKGAAVGIGADSLTDYCRQLEDAIHLDACSTERLALCPQELRDCLAHTILQLDAYIRNKHNTPLLSH